VVERKRAPQLTALAVFAGWLMAGTAAAQEAPPAAEPAPAAALKWEFSGSANVYFLPEEDNFTIPIVHADRGPLHLEARYNYEALDTGSLFAGWTFEHDKPLEVWVTPMLGVVVGDLDGLAPGFELGLTYKRFDLYTEFEYVFDFEDSDGNFLYNWSEMAYVPADWFRVGLTTQRTRVYQTDREIQRGLLLGGSVGPVSFTAHLFNLDDEDPFYVLAVDVDF